MGNLRKEAISASAHWWFCENIVSHNGEIGLLRMDFPRVFVLIRDYAEAYPCEFEDFKEHIAEVNFFTPSERADADIDSILTEAWNFLALEEEAEDRMAEECDGYRDEDNL